MTTRRDIFFGAAAAASAAIPLLAETPSVPASVVQHHDGAVDRYLATQVTDASSRWRGAVPDASGIHSHGAAGGLLGTLGTAFIYAGSRHHHSAEVFKRMELAGSFLERGLSDDGNITLPATNFNSPPDTAFMIAGLGSLMRLAKTTDHSDVSALLTPVLARCGRGLAKGGVHTPNHRWVVCAALAQLNETMPDPAYVRRIDQWLAEGIDIDADGQYTERSTTVYDPVVDRALVVLADKLKRPELLEPVRANLDSLLYLLHPNYEVVTEISRRQDQYQRGFMYGYWFPLQYLAGRDSNGRYAALAAEAAPRAASLPVLLEYPELLRTVPPAAIPDDYEKSFPALGIVRIRRKAASATVVLGGSSRFFNLRRGEATLAALRFASAFFGKGQFIPAKASRQGGAYVLEQELSAGYYQPLETPRKVRAGEWASTRPDRRVTEMCSLRQSATVREENNGFSVRLQSNGTRDVPVAIEMSFPAGGALTGCDPLSGDQGAFLMREPAAAYRAGNSELRFGPMLREHSWVAIRGAEPRIPGQQCVYLTGLTPLDHTIKFEWS
jgi:hypothetical protein